MQIIRTCRLKKTRNLNTAKPHFLATPALEDRGKQGHAPARGVRTPVIYLNKSDFFQLNHCVVCMRLL